METDRSAHPPRTPPRPRPRRRSQSRCCGSGPAVLLVARKPRPRVCTTRSLMLRVQDSPESVPRARGCYAYKRAPSLYHALYNATQEEEGT
eukprot:3849148-Rhodomonas_salina.4